jgi:DNA topoisomerase I
MPVFISGATPRQRVREFNRCHDPKGAPDRNNDGRGDGGAFCSRDGAEPTDGYGDPDPVQLVVVGPDAYQVRDRRRGTPIGLKTPTGIRTTFSRADAMRVRAKWTAARVAGARSYTTSQPDSREFTDMLSYVYGVVEARTREFNPCHEPAGSSMGGRFADKGSCVGQISGAWLKSQRAIRSRRATTGPMRPATKAERKRYVIPPSFVDAMVTTDPRAEVRATAVSPVTGKTRAVYSASYTNRQALAKWSRIAGIHRQMDAIARRVDKDSQRLASPAYQAALALRIIMQTGMRNGAENEHGTFGATSLQMQHAQVTGARVQLAFPGKGGVQQAYTFSDPVLAKYIRARRQMDDAPEAPLFDHSDEDTLAYMKKVAGAQYKVHDLRTWYGTVYADQLATKLLSEGLAPTTKKERVAFQKAVATKVAAALGNTPAVTLKTYIHPWVWKAIE